MKLSAQKMAAFVFGFWMREQSHTTILITDKATWDEVYAVSRACLGEDWKWRVEPTKVTAITHDSGGIRYTDKVDSMLGYKNDIVVLVRKEGDVRFHNVAINLSCNRHFFELLVEPNAAELPPAGP